MSKSLGPNLAIEAGIFCDGIREELLKKHTLLGVTIGPMYVPNFPSTILVAAYVDLATLAQGYETIEIRWMFDGVEQRSAETQVTMTPPSHVALLAPPQPISMPNAGELTFEMRVKGDKKWVVAKKTTVGLPE